MSFSAEHVESIIAASPVVDIVREVRRGTLIAHLLGVKINCASPVVCAGVTVVCFPFSVAVGWKPSILAHLRVGPECRVGPAGRSFYTRGRFEALRVGSDEVGVGCQGAEQERGVGVGKVLVAKTPVVMRSRAVNISNGIPVVGGGTA